MKLSMKEQIRAEFIKTQELFSKIIADEQLLDDIKQVANILIQAIKADKKILLCGNGGSAADCQHIAAELVGRFKKERKALNAIALTTDSSIITAIANDYDYDYIFARQIEGICYKDDILIGISTSGKSKNVIKAFEAAKAKQAKTIALIGESEIGLAEIADYTINIPENNTAKIQEAHIATAHILCSVIDQQLFSKH